MTTASTNDIYDSIRAQITASLSASVEIYNNQPAQDVTYPYGILRVLNAGAVGQDYEGVEQAVSVELTLVHNPKSNRKELENMGDDVEAAMLHFTEISSNNKIQIKTLINRSLLPPFPAPADNDVIQLRMNWDADIVKQFLT